MRRYFGYVTLLALALLVVMAGCSSTSSDESQKPSSNAESSPSQVVAGGWHVNTEAHSTLTNEELEVFQKAVSQQEDLVLEPVAVLATQVVAGTNLAYLCTGAEAGAENAQAGWYVVEVYHDLQDGAHFVSAKPIDVTDLSIAEARDPEGEPLVGAWAVSAPRDTSLLPAEAQAAFSSAMGGYDGATLTPIATLGSQVVAGTNYRVLCARASSVADGSPELCVVQVYQPLDGEAQVTEVSPLDLLAYLA